MSTLAELVSKLRSEIRMDSSDKIWPTSLKEQYINNAYNQVQKDGEYNWRENQGETTFSLTSGTQKYSLPSDFVRLDYIQTNTDNQPLTKTTYSNVKRFGSSSSKPNNYFLYGTQIGFYPTPDSSYSADMLYRKRLTKLSDTQDSELPEDFDDAIVKYAAYLLWSSPRGNAQTAAQKLQDYQLEISKLRLEYIMQDSNDLKFAYQVAPINNRSDKAIYN